MLTANAAKAARVVRIPRAISGVPRQHGFLPINAPAPTMEEETLVLRSTLCLGTMGHICWSLSFGITCILGDTIGRSKEWIDVVHRFTGDDDDDDDGAGVIAYCRL